MRIRLFFVVMLLACVAFSANAVAGLSSTEDLSVTPQPRPATASVSYGWTLGESVKVNDSSSSYHIRSSYQYVTNNTIRHKLEVSRVNLTIYAPLPWNYSEAVPGVEVSMIESGDDYILTLGTEDESSLLTLYFVSGPGFGRQKQSQKQYLAVTDISQNYFQNPGFEGEWQEDWTVFSAAFDWDSIELNTTVVSEGAFSLRMENTLVDRSIMNHVGVPAGYYYVSLSYYYEESPTGYLALYVRKPDTNWQSIPLSTSITGRWIKFFAFVHYDGGTQYFRLDTLGTFAGVIFIDDFRIWEANPAATTLSNYPLTTFSVILRSIDNYDNPTVSNEVVNFQIRDRTADTVIDSFTATTDDNGFASKDWGGRLEQKEIELRAWSLSSHFGVQGWSKELWLNIIWNCGSGLSSSYTVYDDRVEMINQKDGAGVVYWYSDYFTLDYDFSNVDVYVIDLQFNESESIRQHVSAGETSIWSSTESTASNFYKGSEYASSDTIRQKWYWVRPQEWVSTDELAMESVDGLYSLIVIDNSANDFFKMTYYDFYGIQSQKSYFTPMTVGTLDYAQIDGDFGKDGWDFSEETIDSATRYQFTVPSATSGYLYAYATSTGGNIRWDSLSIDSSYFNHAIVRIKTNSSSGASLQIYDSGNNDVGQITQSITSSYSILIYSLGGSWGGAETSLRLQITDLVADDLVKIDYVRVVHREEGCSGNGFVWELQEDETITNYGTDFSSIANGIIKDEISGDLEIENGEAVRTIVSSYKGVKFHIESEVTQTDFPYFLIEIKASEALSLWFYGDSSHHTSCSITTDYQTYIVSNPFDDWLNNHQGIILETKSSPTSCVLYIRRFLCLSTTISSGFLYETDSSFFTLSSNNSMTSRFCQDNVLWGDYNDLEHVPKNNTPGSHSLSFWSWKDNDNCPQGPFIPSCAYYYSWNTYNETQGLLDALDSLETNLTTLINNINTSLSNQIAAVNSSISTLILNVNSSIWNMILELETNLTNLINSVNSSLHSELSSVNSSLWNKIQNINTTLYNLITSVNSTLSAQIAAINSTVYENCTFNWNNTLMSEVNATLYEVNQTVMDIIADLARDPNEAPAAPPMLFLLVEGIIKGWPLIIFAFLLFFIIGVTLWLFWTRVIK